ncbi:unnamed protein product [Durusdinium trenchii]|uniref:Uncharacterized protein n=1 Tax=Durusdinium trenchii TaxID=1381693 RepID=A0ABP0RYM5_9DINO
MLINAFLEGINLQDLGGHFTGLTTHGVNGFELLRQLTLEYSLRTRSEALSLRTALAGRSFEPSRSGASVCTASCIGRVVSQVWRFDVVVAGQWGYKATSHIIRSVSNVRVDILCFSIDDGGAGNLTGRPQWPWSCRDFGSRNEWKHLESSISGGTVLDYNRGASALGLWSTESRVRSCHLKREEGHHWRRSRHIEIRLLWNWLVCRPSLESGYTCTYPHRAGQAGRRCP